MTNIKSPVSWVGNKAPILPIIYNLFPLEYGRFVEVFGGSGSVLLGKPPGSFEVYNDFDRNLVNLFHCMKDLGFVISIPVQTSRPSRSFSSMNSSMIDSWQKK